MKKIILLSFTIIVNTTLALAQWQFTGGPANDTVNNLLASESSIFAGTNVGIYFTGNGSGWEPGTNSLAHAKIQSLASNGTDMFGNCPGKGIYISADSGVSWSPANSGLADSTHILSMLTLGNDVFTGTAGGGVYTSTNNGLTWTQVNNGLLNLSVNALAAGSSTVFAATQAGIFESANFGASWLPINFKSINVSSLAIMDNTLFAGTDSGLFISTDNGSDWLPAGNGLVAGYVYSLVENEINVVAATDKGVFLSTDDGVNWAATNDGLGEQPVNSVVLFNNDIYIGTEGSGVWKRSLTNILSGVKNISIDNTINIYPNPAANTLTISSEQQLSNKYMEITDILGRSLLVQQINSSNYATINVGNLPQGGYLICIKNSAGIELVRKFVKE